MADPDFAFARQSYATMNLGRFLTHAAARKPNHPALIFRDQTISYGALNARTDALAHALVSMGVSAKDRVLIHSNNHPDMVAAIYAIWKTGAVIVPTNFRAAPDDIVKMAHAAGATAFIGNEAFGDHLAAMARDGGCEGATLTINGNLDAAIAKHTGDGPFQDAAVLRDDPAWFFFTSGTTGFPKCAVLTHGQMGFVLNNHVADLMPGLSARDASLVIAPLSHGAGLHLFVQVTQCATNVLMPDDRFDVPTACALIEKHRVSNLFAVPTIVKRLVEDDTVTKHDLSSLKHVVYAGAPMYRVDQIKALDVLGPVIVQYFGLGEVTGAITVLPADEHDIDDAKMRVGSCGYPRTGMEVAIFAPDGTRLGAHETGAIGVRGGAVFSGYLNNAEANAESFVDGWFLTGDIGHLDEGGYLYLTGRKSDMYISGGSNIYPREIEEVILTHPDVDEVAIVGVPDRDWGEAGVAVIVGKVDVETLRHWIAQRVARYKQPRDIFIWDALPKSGYGKVEKKTVRQMLFDQKLVPETV